MSREFKHHTLLSRRGYRHWPTSCMLIPIFWHTMQLPSSGWSEAEEGCSLIHGNYCRSKCQNVQHSAVHLEGHVIKETVWKRGVKSDFSQFFEHKLRSVWFHLLRGSGSLSWSINSLPSMGPKDSSPCSQKSPLSWIQSTTSKYIWDLFYIHHSQYHSQTSIQIWHLWELCWP